MPRARRAVALGRRAAVTLGHRYLGPEYLLLGIPDEGENLGVRVLEALELVPEDVQGEFRSYIKSGDAPENETPLTPNLRAALALATEEGAKLGHNYIGCEHLLLGLIAEPEGLASSVLRQLGLELRVTRRAVDEICERSKRSRRDSPVERPPRRHGALGGARSVFVWNAPDVHPEGEIALDDEAGAGEVLLRLGLANALEYATSIDHRGVAPDETALAALAAFDEPLPDLGADPLETLCRLHQVGSPATVASTGHRYFGFVTGATYPVALASSWLVSSWDQNAALPVMSPVASKLHDVVRGWLIDVLRLPIDTGVAFVSGATVANASCLAAARDALLAQLGWDSQADGLFGAPELNVVVGERAHSTLSKSLGLVGLGRSRVIVVPADDQGRMRADLLPDIDGPVLVCAQAGEVNTGAFDPFDRIADWANERSGWLHVDGAFGLWALADPGRSDLVCGLDRADSWATDGHKWLNVTYDCGIAFVRRRGDLRRTFAAAAGYLPPSAEFEAMHHTPQSSQRARQVEVWSVLRTLGRRGVEDLVVTACDVATAMAERLSDAGLTILNDVVLNQVLVRLVDGPTTEAMIAEIQRDGRVWCGPTQWGGGTAMRISVSSWKTDLEDAGFAADVIVECAGRTRPSA